MENNEFIRRLEDLAERCERQSTVTQTNFLTPAEAYQAERWAKARGISVFLTGGSTEAERKVCFFLPYWMEGTEPDIDGYFRSIEITAHFGTPGHRDYMGALLGMGIGREWLGDIAVIGDRAYIFCLPSVEHHLLSIDKVGRCGVTAKSIKPSEVPMPEKQVKELTFSVMSPRLDAIVAGMFSLSRTEAAKQIEAGLVSLNYTETDKTDRPVQDGDIISLRGAGKGKVNGSGGTSRKGRLFIYAEIYK